MIRHKKHWKNILENRSLFGILRDFGNQQFDIEYDKSKELFSIGTENEARKKGI